MACNSAQGMTMSATTQWWARGLLAGLLPALFFAQTVRSAERSLGGSPVCEASAAALVPCAGPADRCMLVGDNEVRDRLFHYRLEPGGVDVASRRSVKLSHLLADFDDDRGELSDIEGIAVDPEGRVLVLGSHSRNSQCKQRPARRRLLQARYADGELYADGLPAGQSPAHRCGGLFVGAIRDDPLVRRICRAIQRSEVAADAASAKTKKKRAVACRSVSPLNAEGVAAVTRATGGVDVWVGLRAPLVDGKAVLLKQASEPNRFRFEAALLVDLSSRGIRELSFSAGHLFGIAGPAEDADVPFRLWRLPADSLLHGRELRPEALAELPASSEGLVVLDHRALVLIDGDEGKQAGVCARPASYIVLDLAP